VADAETEVQIAAREAHERIARSKTGLFFDWCNGVQISLAIFRRDIAIRINKNLGIVNCWTNALRNPADDRNRQLPGDFLKSGNESASPGSGVSLNDWHRIAGINHLRKDD